MDLNKVSKYISLILRHKPEAIGITLDEHGWANVYDLIRGVKKKYSDFGIYELIQIVDTDEKQRYSFNEDVTMIRANQGHSIPVDLELEPVRPPEYLYHGTAKRFDNEISKSGLLHMGRQYVHLSKDIDTAYNVGLRHAKKPKEVIIYKIDARTMYYDGYEFFLSENGVWLTNHVPSAYLAEFEEVFEYGPKTN